MCQELSFAAWRCSLVICMSLSNTYIINTIYLSKTASISDEYCSSYNIFPSFFHEKWWPSWIFENFRFFLPISLSSSIRSIYRKLHQNRTSSSRVIEENTYRQTDRQTDILYPFIYSRDLSYLKSLCIMICL